MSTIALYTFDQKDFIIHMDRVLSEVQTEVLYII
jgi:hypothetical protein